MGITMGIARGIQFLHTGTQHAIFGNDLKIDTVLLDDTLTAKISSYNISLLAKVGSESPLNDPSQVPHRAANSEKDDIYQFGIIILQLITGKPLNSEDEITDLKNEIEIGLTESPNRLKEVVDSSIRGTFASALAMSHMSVAVNMTARPANDGSTILEQMIIDNRGEGLFTYGQSPYNPWITLTSKTIGSAITQVVRNLVRSKCSTQGNDLLSGFSSATHALSIRIT